MSDYRELTVWRKAHGLTMEIYRITRTFPSHERFGLCSQLRRAAISAVSNIVEGTGRVTPGEYGHFLSIARGSIREVECQLLIARDLGYLQAEQWSPLDAEAQQISRMLKGLITSLKARPK